MSEPVTCGWCGLTHDSPRSEVVHRGTRECVDSAACAERMAQKENDALRAEVERLREALREIARPKRGGIEANDSDEEWLEYLRGALERERATARAALVREGKP